MPSKVSSVSATNRRKSTVTHVICFGMPKYSRAMSKLVGLQSTTTTRFPVRASIVARLPPPHPSSRTLFAGWRKRRNIWTYGNRLSPEGELRLWKISPSR
jgi:hypothetical protein